MNYEAIKVRNLLLGDGIPKICIPITGATIDEIKDQMAKILEGPCDLVEWRADFLNDSVEEKNRLLEIAKLLREELKEIPLLFTFRTKEEGGEKSIPIHEYEKLCVQAAETGYIDMVDVELNRGAECLARLAAAIHEKGVLVIGSYHDFDKTPSAEEITEILASMQPLGVDITKAALMPKCEADVLHVLEASLKMKHTLADRPYITMSMGRLGGVSRLSGKLTGSAVTFATAGRASAPGQMEAEAVSRILAML